MRRDRLEAENVERAANTHNGASGGITSVREVDEDGLVIGLGESG